MLNVRALFNQEARLSGCGLAILSLVDANEAVMIITEQFKAFNLFMI